MKVKHHLQSQLRELEPMPELLRSSELRLQQMTEQLEQLKQLHDHDMRRINDLTAKVVLYYCLISLLRLLKTNYK